MPTAEYDAVARLSAQLQKSTDPATTFRLTKELQTAANRLPTSLGRKADFLEDDALERRAQGLSIERIFTRPSRNDEERDAAEFVDHAIILGAALHNRDPRTTNFWRRGLEERPWLAKALDSGTAADWVPTETSADLARQVRLETKIAGLLNNVAMPAPTYKLPVQGNPPRAKLVPETTGSEDFLDASKLIPESDPVFGASATLHAKKVAVRCTPSLELTEDSIIPALPLIREEIVVALAQAREDAIINGKRSAGLDGDVTTSNDTRRWVDGFRVLASGASFGNGQAVVRTATAGRIELGDIRKLRQKLGKYGLNPADLFWLTNSAGYSQLMSLTDGNGNPLVVTLEKYGPQATLVTGSLGALDGIGVILSQFVREDLNRFGIYDGVTTDSSMILLVNRKQFVWGDWRNPVIKAREVIETDQLILVGSQRADAVAYRPTEPICGYIYDVRIPS